MDKDGFKKYLVTGGRSASAVDRCLTYVDEYQEYLSEFKQGRNIDEANYGDLVEYVMMLDRSKQAKKHLWAIRYYYKFTSNDDLSDLAARLREERIERKPFPLREFRGVDKAEVALLAEVGIRNIDQMLNEGSTAEKREQISKSTGIPLFVILEYVKLSDLARIPGVKGIRARLYYDAGIDTVKKIAALEPDELRKIVVDFVEKSGFDGLPTLPAEAKFTVEKAKSLPSIVEY